jgi:hypothetical protein
MKYCCALDIQNMIYRHINPGTLMDINIMKITVCGVYCIQNSAVLQNEAGGNTEEREVDTDRKEG